MSKFLTDEQVREIAQKHGVEYAVIKAIHEVESKGRGFLASGEPKILFERHIFWRELQKLNLKTLSTQMSVLRPDLCYRSPTTNGGYGDVNSQHQRLQDAINLVTRVRPDTDDELKNSVRECALKACSWGLGQIMGFNYHLAGHKTLQSFINAMYDSEKAQLEAMIAFLHSAGLQGAMKSKNWQAIAKAYNGVNYARFSYDVKLKKAYRKYA